MYYHRHEAQPLHVEAHGGAAYAPVAAQTCRGLRRIAGTAHMIARFTLAVLAGVPTTTLPPLLVTLLLARRFRDEDRLRRWHAMVPWASFVRKVLLGIELSVAGRDNLPRPSRGHLFVSNHQSYVDIPVLMDALETVAFLSKKAILYVPVIGLAAYAGGTVFFERGDRRERGRALRDTLRMCKESTAVVVFPEGTRSMDGSVREEIRPGAIAAAWERGLRVVPIGLDGTLDVVPKSMDRVNLGRHVAVTIGTPLAPEDYGNREQFVRAVWDAVRGLHQMSRARIG